MKALAAFLCGIALGGAIIAQITGHGHVAPVTVIANVAEPVTTEQGEVQEYADEAARRYLLKDWTIRVHVVSAERVGYTIGNDQLPHGRVAYSEWNGDHKRADLWIMQRSDWKKFEHAPDPLLEQQISVTHEYGHIILSSLRRQEGLLKVLDELGRGKRLTIPETKY